MGSNPRFAHINCHDVMAVANLQSYDVMLNAYDIVSLNEPYVSEEKLLGSPVGYTQVSSKRSRFWAALWVRKCVSLCVVKRLPDVVAIRCTLSGQKDLVVTCYCALSEDIEIVLVELERLLRLSPGDHVILVGDFNV